MNRVAKVDQSRTEPSVALKFLSRSSLDSVAEAGWLLFLRDRFLLFFMIYSPFTPRITRVEDSEGCTLSSAFCIDLGSLVFSELAAAD
jgi:hypothetical protein